MLIRDVMSRDVQTARPDETIQEAAATMMSIDAGILPVGEHDRLVGTITDRDMAMRAVATGLDPTKTKVRDIMSREVRHCYEDETTDHVAETMGELKVRRLPVLNRDERLVGIVSLGNLARRVPTSLPSSEALRDISQPGGPHSQTIARAEEPAQGPPGS
jgi:CBS domain-containing protein